MGKIGSILVIIGIVMMAASQAVGEEKGKTQLDTRADIGDPFREGAENVAAVEDIQSSIFPLADLFIQGKKVGQVLGAAERGAFYLRALLEGGSFLNRIVAQDYRNASYQGYSFVSEVALVYALEVASGGGIAWIAVQIVLSVALSPEGWRATESSQTSASEVSDQSVAFSNMPGFIADGLWGIYEFVKTNLREILLVGGLFVLILAVALLARGGH